MCVGNVRIVHTVWSVGSTGMRKDEHVTNLTLGDKKGKISDVTGVGMRDT